MTDEETLNTESYIDCFMDEVILRIHQQDCCSAMFVTPFGEEAKAVIAYNLVTKRITIRFAKAPLFTSAWKIAMKIWGRENVEGGKLTAVSPYRPELIEMIRARDAVYDALNER